MQSQEIHQHWSSRFAFLLAAIGAAVGLGNFWRFPYMAGANGGGAFVLIYVLCVLAIALPILMAELVIGRRGGLSAIGSTRKLALDAGHSAAWSLIGWVGMIGSFLILTFYSVIAGWIIAYIPMAGSGVFDGVSAETSAAAFDDLLSNPLVLAICHSTFMALTVFIVARGLRRGIELAVQILMPLFFIMLIGVVVFSWIAGDVRSGLTFLFSPDFSKISVEVVLQAIGQAFFSIGVGAAIMITYGAYLPRDTRIPQASLIIVLSDTGVAILAAIAIFPIVFAFGLDPAQGPGLIFVTLPIAFGQMPFGQVYGTVFFVLALFAALTSSISLLEILVSWGEEHRGWRRRATAIYAGTAAWFIGLASVFSTNIWSGYYPLGMFDVFREKTIFDLLDYITANFMLPLGGILVSVFAGWLLSRQLTLDELGMSDGPLFKTWRFLLRYVAPICVGAVLLYLTGIADFWNK